MELLQYVYYLIVAFFAAGEFIPLLFLKKKQHKRLSTPSKPISIIIPIKNEEQIIEKTIKVWLAIDYKAEKEIIFCDQRSTDKTKEIIESYAKSHLEIQYYDFGKTNKLSAMLAGVKKAKYELLVLSDADRLPFPHSLSELVPYLTDTTGSVFGMGKVVHNPKLSQQVTTIDFLNNMLELQFYSNVYSAPYLYLNTCLVKRSLLKHLNPETLVADDLYLALNIIMQGEKVVFVPGVIVGEENVVDFSDVIKRRLRVSQGTIEIAKSNFLHTVFKPQYKAFGMFLMPFRQLMTITNVLFFIFCLLNLLGILTGYTSLKQFIILLFILYSIFLISLLTRALYFNKLFPETAKSISWISIIFSPFFTLFVRKFLAGFTFVTALFGVQYRWKKSLSDRKKIGTD